MSKDPTNSRLWPLLVIPGLLAGLVAAGLSAVWKRLRKVVGE